jgi:hypothetical protein
VVDTTKFVGLDVSKEKIAVGIADRGRECARYCETVGNSPEVLRKLMGKLGEPGYPLPRGTPADTCGHPPRPHGRRRSAIAPQNL